MVVDEHNELPEATPREAELQRQLDGIQSQVTKLNIAQIEVTENPELEGEARRTLQASGAKRRKAHPARIGESKPPRREPSPQYGK